MFDPFVKAVFVNRHQSPFSNTPTEVLKKVANGEVKLSFGRDDDWLEKFIGSPLLEQAVQLEQQALQIESETKQHDKSMRNFWEMRDQIDLQKKLLDLQLVMHHQNQASAPAMDSPAAEVPPSPESGADAVPPVHDSAVEKMSADASVRFADALGRMMAQQDMQKVALNLAGMGQSALGLVKNNPVRALSAAGGALGAGYGALTAKGEGGNSPTIGQRLGRAVGYGAMGAGAGAMAGGGVHLGKGIHAGMQQGQTARQALGSTLESGLTHVMDRGKANLTSEVGQKALGRAGVTPEQAGQVMTERIQPAADRVREFLSKHLTNAPGNVPA